MAEALEAGALAQTASEEPHPLFLFDHRHSSTYRYAALEARRMHHAATVVCQGSGGDLPLPGTTF